MLSIFSAQAIRWRASTFLRQEERFTAMDDKTIAKWTACIPVWTNALPDLQRHRSWIFNMYRHGHRMTDDPVFWKNLQKKVEDTSSLDLDMALTQAGLFNNPMPFLCFEPRQTKSGSQTGLSAYAKTTLEAGSHPLLGPQLASFGPGLPPEFGVFSFMVNDGKRDHARPGTAQTLNIWRFMGSGSDLPITNIIDMYKSILSFSPRPSLVATWAHAAWSARTNNTCLHTGNDWATFEKEIQPLFAPLVDWGLIAASHGFKVNNNVRDNTIANHVLQRKSIPGSFADNDKLDAVVLSVLGLTDPQTPWDIYDLFVSASQTLDAPPRESYTFDFN